MRIISFFSFKGGVGRTALLANLGALWASEGKVVVLVDMDFFAPGLTYLPQGGQPLDPEHWQGGMSDLLDAFVERGWADQNLAFVPPTQLLREMSWPEQGQGTGAGRLLLIDVGTRVNNLLARGFSSRSNNEIGAMRAVPPREGSEVETPEQTVLRVLARHIRKDLEDFRFPEGDPAFGKGIDYVLIDSRTGWAELQDLSLGYLADQMVVVSGLNDQNLRGLELTLEALKKEGRVPVDMFASLLTIVFSPVPAAEDQATLDALDRGHQVIAGALRVTRAGIREKAPLSTAIHYSPSLAISDDLVALARPRALYSQEIRYVSDLLLGKVDTDKDVLIKESRSRTLRIVPLARSTPPERPSEAVKDLPQRLAIAVNAELPPWWWPLGSDAEAEARLAKLAPPNPRVSMDRGVFVTMFCHSISFTAAEKQKFFASFPRLSQFQVEETVRLLETEQQQFQQLMAREPQHHPALLALYFQHQRDWAGLILGSERAGLERFLRAPLEGESLFPAWEKTPVYWQLLAQDLLLRLNDPDAARQALERARVPDRDAEAVVSDFLDRLPKEGERPTLPEPAEKLALKLAPDSAKARFMVARSRWRRDRHDLEAREALELLLKTPPGDPVVCHEIAIFAQREATELVALSEPAMQQAIALAPENSRAWDDYGDLLALHLGRHSEAEAAYRKAIELDPALRYPWNSLGNLLQDHLDRYDEAEQAYRKAIESDPKFAYPWNGLGNLLKDHLARYDEAEDAYRKAIEIDPKYATPWNSLGLLMRDFGRNVIEARKCFVQGLEIDPENAYLNMNFGYLLLSCGKPTEATLHLEKSLGSFARNTDWQSVTNSTRLALELGKAELFESLQIKLSDYRLRHPEVPYIHWATALLAMGLGDRSTAEVSWKTALDAVSSYGERHALLWPIYTTAVARPDLWPTLASFARDLLDLPEQRLASFRDIAPPAELLERFRPFAEGAITEPYDPRNPLYQPLDDTERGPETDSAQPRAAE